MENKYYDYRTLEDKMRSRRTNNDWYHDVADEMPNFETRFQNNLKELKTLGQQALKTTDQKALHAYITALQSQGQNGRDYVKNVLDKLLSDSDMCYQIADHVVEWRKQSLKAYGDDDPAHVAQVKKWEEKRAEWLKEHRIITLIVKNYGS